MGDEANAQRSVERYQQKLRAMEASVKALREAGFAGAASAAGEPQSRPESPRETSGSAQSDRT
jgi:hypothetical protein